MTIKLVNMYDNTIRILKSKSTNIPLFLSANDHVYLINEFIIAIAIPFPI